MARVKMEKIVDHLGSKIRNALDDATRHTLDPEVNYDVHALYRNFVRAVSRKCNNWETVPDSAVEKN
jgi:hypothetical protein